MHLSITQPLAQPPLILASSPVLLSGAMTSWTGRADLPLHGGRVPPWLATRMERLGRVIVEAIVLEYGRPELLRRLAHPFWFQSFGAVMGMDWHSSGITTSVLGALKRGLAPIERELGVYVCGGRGRHSRRTPDELARVGDVTGLDGEALGRASRLVAKVDSAAVQDGFALYLHGFVVTSEGAWTVVQQGMRPETRTARRYHWISEGLGSFVDSPHAAVEGEPGGPIVNLADRRAARARDAEIELVRSGPEAVLRELRKLSTSAPAPEVLPHLVLPFHHEVTANDVVGRRIAGPSRPRANVCLKTSPSYSSCRALARAPSSRSRRSPKCCTACPRASATPRASHWPMAAKMVTHIPSPSTCTTRRWGSSVAPLIAPSWAKTTSSARSSASTMRRDGSRRVPESTISMRTWQRNERARPSGRAEASEASRPHPIAKWRSHRPHPAPRPEFHAHAGRSCP